MRNEDFLEAEQLLGVDVGSGRELDRFHIARRLESILVERIGHDQHFLSISLFPQKITPPPRQIGDDL